MIRHIYTAACILAFAVFASAAPIQERAVPDWLWKIFHPSPGNGSSSAQIQCYALPYGGLGLASHFLTYITAIILMLGHEPLRPWKPLKQSVLPRLWNTMIGIVSLVFTVAIAALTMESCRGQWPFLLLAFWKLTLSFSMGMLSVIGPWHHSHHRKKLGELLVDVGETVKALPLTLFPYLIGTICGIAGLMYLIHVNFRTNRSIWILTITLIACVGFALLIGLAVAIYSGHDEGTGTAFATMGFALLICITIFVILVVFFSDLVLAALNNNWSGAPGKEFALLYWLYFASKRLPMLSI